MEPSPGRNRRCRARTTIRSVGRGRCASSGRGASLPSVWTHVQVQTKAAFRAAPRRGEALKNPRMRLSVLLLLVLCVAVSAAAGEATQADDLRRCPQEERQTPAPKGGYSVSCEPAPGVADRHALVLRDEKGRRVGRILEFDRHVAFAWAPDGSAIAITDFTGSSDSVCRLATIGADGSVSTSDISAKLPRPRAKGHYFCEILEWRRAKNVRFKTWGYGGEPASDAERGYTYDTVSGGIRAVRGPH
jgi:hypothetical protein